MDKELLTKYYSERNLSASEAEYAVKAVEKAEVYLKASGITLHEAQTEDIKRYIESIYKSEEMTLDALLAIARYYYLIGNHDIYIYFTKILGGRGVIDNIKRRAEKYAGKDVSRNIFEGLEEPALGADFDEIPKFTRELMKRMEQFIKPELYQKILAGNNHDIPEDAMLEEKLLYEKSDNLEEYLEGRHKRNVAELQRYCDEQKVWYEQKITQPVVDYVKSNQEILSAVKKGNKLYITKIPYDIINFLNETDPVLKRYYACHCPFARESILNNNVDVPSDWCYCSAGFAKFPFETILQKELKVRLLNSALKGDSICRFEINLD